MQEIKLKFGGTLLVEDYEYNNGLREEEDRLKLFDSDGKYLDYWNVETIDDIAEVEDLEPKEVWRRVCKKMECCKTIERLLDFLSISYSKISKDWKDIIPELDKEHNFINTYEISFCDRNDGKGIPRIWTGVKAEIIEMAKQQVFDKYSDACIVEVKATNLVEDNWTEEKVKNNEWTNRIGDYYIALCEY